MDDSVDTQVGGDSVPNILADWRSGTSFDTIFERLFRVFYRPLYGFFLRRGCSAQQSDDLTQESFLRIYKSMGGFRGDAKLETWMFQIATNVYRQDLRDRGAKKRAADTVDLSVVENLNEAENPGAGSLPDPAQPAVQTVLEKERQRVVEAAMAQLPEQMGQCVRLRVEQDLTYREVAAVMRLSIDTVKSHLFQARQKLKGLLADYFEDVDV